MGIPLDSLDPHLSTGPTHSTVTCPFILNLSIYTVYTLPAEGRVSTVSQSPSISYAFLPLFFPAFPSRQYYELETRLKAVNEEIVELDRTSQSGSPLRRLGLGRFAPPGWYKEYSQAALTRMIWSMTLSK